MNPGQPCPKCGHPMPPRIRRCYRCVPAGKKTTKGQPRDARGRLMETPVPASFRIDVPARPGPPPDPAALIQAEYARLAEMERRRAVAERQSRHAR